MSVPMAMGTIPAVYIVPALGLAAAMRVVVWALQRAALGQRAARALLDATRERSR